MKKILLLSLLLAGRAAAQTPMPAVDEPHHRKTLENEYVRILDVQLDPGEATLYHVHVVPSVVVELSHATVVSQPFGQPMPQSTHFEPGDTRYAAYDLKPFTHRVINLGRARFHVLDIELPRKNPDSSLRALAPPQGSRVLFDEPLVRTYELTADGSYRCEFPASSHAYLLVAVSGTAVLDDRRVAAGNFLYLPPDHALSVGADANERARCVLLELK